MIRLSGKNYQKKTEQVHKVILGSVNNPHRTLCSASCPDPKHAPLGWIYSQLREARSRLGRVGTCRVRMWASSRGSSCSSFPLTSRARRLRRPLTLPGSSLSLFPTATQKPIKTMEPSQTRSQQAHLLQHQSITTQTAHVHRSHRDSKDVTAHQGQFGIQISFSAEVTAAGWICAFYQENICTMECSSLGPRPREGRKGTECEIAHPGLRAADRQAMT